MAYPWYREGTITLTNGSATVAGTTTGWGNPAFAREGDALWVKIDGVLTPVEEIASVGSNTELTLRDTWEGDTIEDAEYAIVYGSLARISVASLSYDIATFTRSIIAFIAGSGAPDNGEGENGWGYIDEAAFDYYRKEDGVWVLKGSLLGDTGPAGPSYAATSTSSVAIGFGAKSFATQVGLPYLPGVRLRLSSDANPTTHYIEGVVASYDDETGALVVTSDRAIGSGSRADWSIHIAGDVGSTGATGASFAAASTTSLAIGTGSKAFTVAAGLAYVAGQRVRASSAADLGNHMEGVIASYAGTTLTVTVDRTSGSGTFADWSIGLIGAVGATGRGYMATSATSRTIGDGLMSFTTQENLAYTEGARVRFSSAANPNTHYMEGLVDSYSGTALAVIFDYYKGSGARADWLINLAGDKGDAAYAASSTTSNTIGVGTKTFTIAAGLAYLPGTRVRFASAAGVLSFMEGVVTSYSGTTIIVSVDKFGGSGSRADWNVSVAGQPGIDGLGAGTVNSALGGIELASAGAAVQLTDTGVTPGTYSNPAMTVDAKGRITAIESTSLEDPVAMAIVFGA
jgi:hypothetical protein